MTFLNKFLDKAQHKIQPNTQTVENILYKLVDVLRCRRTTDSVLSLGLSDYCDYSDRTQLSNKLCGDIARQIRHFEKRLDNITVEPADFERSSSLHFKISASTNNKSYTFCLELAKQTQTNILYPL